MARPLSIEFPGAIYHVMSRGNTRQKIFRDDRDYQRLLDGLEAVVAKIASRGWGLEEVLAAVARHFRMSAGELVEAGRGDLRRAVAGWVARRYTAATRRLR